MSISKSYYPKEGMLPGYVAEQITLEETFDHTREIISLTGAAYAAEVQNPINNTRDGSGKPLLRTSVLAHYNADDPAVRERFIARTKRIHDLGGRITVVREAANPSAIISYCKIGPAPNMTPREYGLRGTYDYDGYYINNIVTHPDYAGKGAGSVALYAALLNANATPTDELVLDAMNGNTRANRWYERLGFRPQPQVPTCGLDFANQEVPQQYYYTPTAAKTLQHLFYTIGPGA